MRVCEICHTSGKELIYTQSFLLPEENKAFHYNIVLCKKCGFIFADDIPSQEEYNRYYELNSRYIYKNYNGQVPEGTRILHQKYFSILENFLEKHQYFLQKEKLKVLDIGCATGYFLSLFKEKGYNHVMGIEPAKECRSIARRFYDIEVIDTDLSNFSSKEKFDIIILNAVMEHIVELSPSMDKITSILADQGLIYVVVPDAENFAMAPIEPFYEFSLEHINYFTKSSLQNLMGTYGFQSMFTETFKGEHPDSAILASIWQQKTQGTIRKDANGIKSIKSYIQKSSQKLMLFTGEIDKIIQNHEKIIIWGCGSFTSRLMATTPLLKVNLVAFIDSRENLQNKSIAGITIKNPEYIIGKKETILIGSIVYGKEIAYTLKQKYHYEGKVLLFE